MKKATLVSLSCVLFFPGMAAYALPPPCTTPACAQSYFPPPPPSHCTTINLKNGTHTSLPGNMSFVVSPVDTNSDGYYETVLKITLKPLAKNILEKAQFSISYDETPMGNSVDIGDSSTNNGAGGDAGTQSNDAETQIGKASDTTAGFTEDPTLWVFGHDGVPNPSAVYEATDWGEGLAVVPQSVGSGDTITLNVSNEALSFDSSGRPVSGNIQSTWLYALNGQPDTEGPVNYDIYAGFNRVIYDPTLSRLGQGVETVEICTAPDLE